MATGYAPQVESFNKKWAEIAKTTRAEGIPDAVAAQVYSTDLKRLQTPGSYTQSGDQLLDEIRSAGTGKPVVSAPPANPGNVVGNVVSDVKDFGAGLAGLFGKALGDIGSAASGDLHPIEGQVSALWRDPRVLTGPLESLIGIGPEGKEDALYAAGQSPLLSTLVPGLAVGSKFVTSKGHWDVQGGMDNLAEHPFTSALDLLPLAHGAARGASSLAKVGLSDAERSTIEDAGQYKPTDISPAAKAARAQARDLMQQKSSSFLRYQMAANPGGLLTFMNRFAQGLPFRGDTVGEYLARKINAVTKGNAGPLAATISRLLAEPGAEYRVAMKGVIREADKFYKRHGMTDAKSIDDFTWYLQHRWDDGGVPEGRLSPQQLAQFERALPEYEAWATELANRELAAGRLGLVHDPRTGRTEIRALEGSDATVVARQRKYVETLPRFQAAADMVGEALGGVRIGRDTATQDVAGAVLRELAPLHDYTDARYKDPEVVKGAFPLRRGGRKLPAVAPKVAKLFGPKGRFANLERLLAKGDLAKALVELRSIKKALAFKYVDRNAVLAGARGPVDAAIEATRLMGTDAIRSAIDGHARAYDRFINGIDRIPNAALMPRYNEMFNDALLEHLDGRDVSNGDVQLVLEQVKNGIWYGERFDSIVGAKEMRLIGNSILGELNRERDAGFNPVWVKAINPKQIDRLRRGAFDVERISKPSALKSRKALNPSPVYDPILGLKVAEAELRAEHAAQELFYGEHGIEKRFGMTEDMATQEALTRVPEAPKGSRYNRPQAIAEYRQRNFRTITPEEFIPTKAARGTGAGPSRGILVRRDIADALEASVKARQTTDKPYLRAYQKGTTVFRFSLLNFSLRYQVHIWLAGGMLLMMRADPISMLRQTAPALAMMARDSPELVRVMHDLRRNTLWRPVFDFLVRKGEKSLAHQGEAGGLPVALSHGTAEMGPADLLNDWNFEKGRKLGKWFVELQKQYDVPVDAGMKFANFGANMLRSMAYLIGKQKGGSEEAGMMFARKVFADMEGMTPIERTIIRYVMPFYGWTQHILRYVATLPLDHPYRAMVYSQMVNQEWEDWNTGIPQSMVYLFEIGNTAPSGAATVLDIRQLDPLRSVSDVFTRAGFLSSLNPAIQTALTGVGINTATGDPTELYPTLTLDSFYGTLQNKPQSLNSVLTSAVGQYVPEAGVLDHFLSLSKYTQWAQVNNQNAYQNQLYGALNFPWVPQHINVYQTLAKSESNRYTLAKKAASNAMGDADPNSPQWRALLEYSYVPYAGYLVQPSALRQWAFDSAYRAGFWNGSTATLPPENIVSTPFSAPY